MSQFGRVSVLLPTADARDIHDLTAKIQSIAGYSVVSTVWLRDLPAVAPGKEDKGPGLDPFVLAGYVLALSTDLTKLGVGVSPAGARHPAALTRAAVSLCDLSGEPFRLGIGAGEPSSPWALASSAERPRGTALADYVLNVHQLVDAQSSSALELSRPFQGASSPSLWIASGDGETVARIAHAVEGWMTWQLSPDALREQVQTIRSWPRRPRLASTLNVWFNPAVTKATPRSVPLPSMEGNAASIAKYARLYLETGVDEVILNPCAPSNADGAQLDQLEECVSLLNSLLAVP